MRRMLFAVFVLSVLLSLPLVVAAQTVVVPTGPTAPRVAPTVPNCTALTPAQAVAFVTPLGGVPSGATLLAVYLCTGFGTNLVGDTESLFNVDCSTEISIYKVENNGQQGAWTVPGRVCNGDILSLRTEGTGHYILYGLGSQSVTLPPIIRAGAA